MRRIKVFTDRYPYLGPVIWILTIQYFAVQVVVASAWTNSVYSLRLNTISDLGNNVCGFYGGRYVCSPLHSLMNASLISLGLLMASGSLFIYQEFSERLSSLIGFGLMAIGGVGTILVGLFPENTVTALHTIGATLPFLIGNLSLIILSLALTKISRAFRAYTFLTGLFTLIALVLFVSHHYLGLGIGGMERVVSYPQTIWLIFFGLYMSANRYLKKRRSVIK